MRHFQKQIKIHMVVRCLLRQLAGFPILTLGTSLPGDALKHKPITEKIVPLC